MNFPMTRRLHLTIFTLLVLSCKSDMETKPHKIIRLQKEASSLMLTGFRLETSGSDSAKQYYCMAIAKFLESYYLDTTILELAIYLPDLYYKTNKPDSAMLWQSKLRPIDSVYQPKSHPHY
jgi:hypothetical protein